MLTRVTLTDSWLVSMISVIAGIKRHQGCSSRGKCTVGRHKPIDGKCENLSDRALLLRPERDVSGYEAETDPQLAGLSDLNDKDTKSTRTGVLGVEMSQFAEEV